MTEQFIIDTETGEIMGIEGKQSFVPTTADEVEWTLGLFMETEADILREQALLNARIEAGKALVAGHTRRLEYLRWRFANDLKAYAEKELEGKKGRSLQMHNGKLAFRKGQPKIVVLPDSEADAIEYLEANLPGAVKVSKSILVSQLKGAESELPAGLFDVIPATDSFSIDTGVK